MCNTWSTIQIGQLEQLASHFEGCWRTVCYVGSGMCSPMGQGWVPLSCSSAVLGFAAGPGPIWGFTLPQGGYREPPCSLCQQRCLFCRLGGSSETSGSPSPSWSWCWWITPSLTRTRRYVPALPSQPLLQPSSEPCSLWLLCNGAFAFPASLVITAQSKWRCSPCPHSHAEGKHQAAR